jgi:hypothetical protein
VFVKQLHFIESCLRTFSFLSFDPWLLRRLFWLQREHRGEQKCRFCMVQGLAAHALIRGISISVAAMVLGARVARLPDVLDSFVPCLRSSLRKLAINIQLAPFFDCGMPCLLLLCSRCPCFIYIFLFILFLDMII